jgi:hypothetical protein
MKQHSNHFIVKPTLLISLVFALAITPGCATGPSPEELAKKEQARVEQETQQRRRWAEEELAFQARRQEVVNNIPGRQILPESVKRANELLGRLNAASRSLRIGSINPSETSSLLFLLDTSTGKLTLQTTSTSEQTTSTHQSAVMLRYVKGTLMIVDQDSIQLNEGPRYYSTKYQIRVDIEGALIHYDASGWGDSITLFADNEDVAYEVSGALGELIAIYK